MSHPDNHSICGGDFNSIWDADEHRGPAAPAPHLIGTPEWTVEILPIRSTASIYHNLQTVPKSITFSTIVPPYDTSLRYAVGTDGLWIGLSDHRPMLVVGFTQLAYVHLQNTHWIKIKRFAPQLHKFMSSLRPPGIRSPTNQHLRRRQNVSRLISPRSLLRNQRNAKNVRSGTGSKNTAALRCPSGSVQLLAYAQPSTSPRCLNLFPRRLCWFSSLDRTLGINKVIAE